MNGDYADTDNDSYFSSDDDISIDGTFDISDEPPLYSTPIKMCIVCHKKPQYENGGKSFPTCGLTCKEVLQRGRNSPTHSGYRSRGAATVYVLKCVVCHVKPCRNPKYVTCGLTCAERLCVGGGNPQNCDYCHRRPKLQPHSQCGKTCASNAKIACLLCMSRPKLGKYHLCGQTCKRIATKRTPLILEVPKGHVTYEMVEKKFYAAWKCTDRRPVIRGIYKIFESKSFLGPYDQYKKRVGNEVFLYHGTTSKCTLGYSGNTALCTDPSCHLCSILKTSFSTKLANPNGAFGAGIYTTAASNKAFRYTDFWVSDQKAGSTCSILLNKAVLGNVYPVTRFSQVRSCPAGFDSVVYDRVTGDGNWNESILYSDAAIRPVFLISISV